MHNRVRAEQTLLSTKNYKNTQNTALRFWWFQAVIAPLRNANREKTLNKIECAVILESSETEQDFAWNVQRDVYIVMFKLSSMCVTSTKIDLDLSDAVDNIENSFTQFKDLVSDNIWIQGKRLKRLLKIVMASLKIYTCLTVLWHRNKLV